MDDWFKTGDVATIDPWGICWGGSSSCQGGGCRRYPTSKMGRDL